jgi:hypothetical protein
MTEPLLLPYAPPGMTLRRNEDLPFLELTLSDGQNQIVRHGLVDSGATPNLLPYSDGLALGLPWAGRQVKLSGTVAPIENCTVDLTVKVAHYPAFVCPFTWVRSDEHRLLLGQYGLFQLFDITFHGSRKMFQISPTASV